MLRSLALAPSFTALHAAESLPLRAGSLAGMIVTPTHRSGRGKVRKIVVTFDLNGGSSIEAFGFTGTECIRATKSIEEALGKAGKRVMKSGGGDKVESKQTVGA